MTRWTRSALFLAGWALFSTSPALAQATDSTDLATGIETYLQPYIATGNFNGSVLLAREGSILFSRGYGEANFRTQTPNLPETAYYLASTSRIFTSAAILLMEQEGLLSTADPLSRYLPDWPRGDEITLHHLLTLSSGMPNINQLDGYGVLSLAPQTPASLCDTFRDLPLEFDPGTRPVHSNSNYNVLALLIERLSGMSYGEFLETRFFAPLGMSHTAHDDDPDRAPPYRALGYRPFGLGGLENHIGPVWSVKTGNGSIYGSTEDLYRFDRMLAGGELLNAASIDKLFTEHFPGHGYGWFVGERFGTTRMSISGRSPGFGSAWVRLADPDITVIVLGNIYNGVPGTIANDLLGILMGEDVAPPSLRPDAPDPERLAQVVGSYQFGPEFYNPNGTVSFHIEGGHLFNRSSWMIPAGEDTFVHRTYWSTLTFLRDVAGKVDRLQYDDFVGTRVP